MKELELRLEEGKAEYDRLKEKRNELAARARKAQERKAEQKPSISRGIESGTAARGFERMEEKILEWEASGQLSGYGTSPAAAGADAGIPTPAVNAELERLKQQLSARHS
ncbi:hypothetical protein HMSSN036_89730 [Paenibacillus macerans]|nr:hypothetical protein HMSSN036_89730 [Paenibacillus macerans]